MSTKIITLPERFSTGEPTVQLVATPGLYGKTLRERTSLHNVKTASESPALDFIRSIEPQKGKTIVLVVGLGDHETYGPNRNGDGFPSEPVPGKINADDVLTKHYQSYDNAHVFEHHVNNDPAKAIGKVIKAFWNPHMRRVEVLESFDHDKAPHMLEKIMAGEHPAKSMGCKIPYDVCTCCGNRAATRKDYCDHLKYEMGKIYPDGTQAAALNPKPKFFDSSWVIRPADRTGLMLKKVARESAYEIRTASYDLGEMAENLRAKAAALGKAAVMEKIVSGGSVEASSTGTDKGTVTLIKKYNETSAGDDAASMPAPTKAMKVIIEYSPEDAVGTTDAMGMPMGLKDLLKYFMGRMGAGEPDPVTEDCACKHAGVIAELFANYPRFYDDVMKTAGLANLRVNPELARKLAAATPGTFQHENQAIHDTPLNRPHPHFGSGQATLRPNTDRLSYTDQNGRTYYTNLGAARRTTESLQNQAMGRKAVTGAGMVGLGALMGGAGMSALSGQGRPVRKALGALGVGAGLATAGAGLHRAFRRTRLSDLNSPMIMTNEGEVIPAYTEMKAASEQVWRPEMLHVALRRRDGACADLPERRKLAFEQAVRAAEIHDELSPILGPTLNLEKIALLLEQSIHATQRSL